MAYSSRDDQAAAMRRHYLANKDKIKRRAKLHTAKARRRNWEFVKGYLSSHPCVDCGEGDIVVLEFDHVRGEKRDDISGMVRDCSLSSIKAEIEKCEVRCANCHRRQTHVRRLAAAAAGVQVETMRSGPPIDRQLSFSLFDLAA